MTSGGSFHRLIEQFNAGQTDAAAREVTSRFTARLVALARSRLDRRIQQKEAPEDAVQSALASFFARRRNGDFELTDWNDLWNLLAVVTVRKCLRRAERWQAQKRRLELDASAGGSSSDVLLNATSREPTPDEALLLAETMDAVMRPFTDRERAMIELCLEGCSSEEIAERAQRSLYTVQMVLRRAERSLRKMLKETD